MRQLRLRLFGGLAIFMIPLLAAMILSHAHPHRGHVNLLGEVIAGELHGSHVFEQTVTGRGGSLRAASLFLGTYRRENSGTLKLELVSADGVALASSRLAASEITDNAWGTFKFEGIPLTEGTVYSFRLTSEDSSEGNAVTWYASKSDRYDGGQALIDGHPSGGDFALRLEIDDPEPNGK
jgi:hypothetical protein